MKKLLSATLAVAFIFGAIGASAQTIAVSSATYDPFLTTTPGVPFDVKVWMDTAGLNSSAAEFVVTDLKVLFPSIFKLNTVKINGTTLDLGDNNVGEYLLSFGGCLGAEPKKDLVSVTYGDFGGAIPQNSDIVVALRGFQPGDTRPSSFEGEPGFVDCASNKIVLAVGGQDGGVSGAGTAFGDGTLLLNGVPEPVGAEDDSFGSLKARF